jgi:hypothetical protein
MPVRAEKPVPEMVFNYSPQARSARTRPPVGSPRSPLSIPDFLSTENAMEIRLSFMPFVNTFRKHAFKQRRGSVPQRDRWGASTPQNKGLTHVEQAIALAVPTVLALHQCQPMP